MPDNLKLVVTTEYFSSQELSQQVYFQTDFMRVTLLSHDNLPKGAEHIAFGLTIHSLSSGV